MKRNKTPLIDRVYTRFFDQNVPLLPRELARDKWHYQSLNGTTAESRTLDALLNNDDVYIDAGMLPGVTITPPKDNAVRKINYMIPNKDLRSSFYNSLGQNGESHGFDQRGYINRLWNLYNKSSKPTINSVHSEILNTIPILQKIGLMKGFDTRAHYNPVTNTMYVDPDFAADDIEAEISHAYQIRGTDTPRSWLWMKLFLSRPNGDIKINGFDGYNTPGSTEFVAHSIIEPIFHDYLTGKYNFYGDVYDDIQTAYNNQDKMFLQITSGPYQGEIYDAEYNNFRNRRHINPRRK